jgi:amino acid transporter
VPLALLTTLAAVTLLYMLVIWAYLAIAPEVIGNESALAAAANNAMGHAGVIAISLAAAFSISANTLSGGIVTPRMTYAMAEQGTLPGIFSHISKRFQTPDVSILFYGAAAILFSLWAGFAALAVASTLSRLVMYLLSSLALPVLEHRDKTKAPWWHLLVAAIATLSTLWVASHASTEAYQMLGLILVAGTGLYFIAARDTSDKRS